MIGRAVIGLIGDAFGSLPVCGLAETHRSGLRRTSHTDFLSPRSDSGRHPSLSGVPCDTPDARPSS